MALLGEASALSASSGRGEGSLRALRERDMAWALKQKQRREGKAVSATLAPLNRQKRSLAQLTNAAPLRPGCGQRALEESRRQSSGSGGGGGGGSPGPSSPRDPTRLYRPTMSTLYKFELGELAEVLRRRA